MKAYGARRWVGRRPEQGKISGRREKFRPIAGTAENAWHIGGVLSLSSYDSTASGNARRRVFLCALGLAATVLFAAACDPATTRQPEVLPRSGATGSRAEVAPPPAGPPARRAGPFDAQILEIAQTYRQQFTRVSDQAHWAPQLCLVPSPGGVLLSASGDSDTHGRKLYFLFAKDQVDYMECGYVNSDSSDAAIRAPWKAAVGQALVKQSFVPEPVPVNEAPNPLADDPDPQALPPEYTCGADGTLYRTGDPAALFIMLKTDPATPGTDEGWVYAATTPDGQSIFDAGRIASCIRCHEQTTRDRLYGPLWSWPVDPATGQRVPPTLGNGASSRQPEARP